MNHQKIYEFIIQKAKLENRIKLRKGNVDYIYYENHHILPRCLGGTDEKENLVLLTAREHYVCHKLLTYIYNGNRKIVLSFHRMMFDKVKNRKISSRDYAYLKFLRFITPMSKETRLLMSKTRKERKIAVGKNNGMFGRKHKKESILKMKKPHREFSIETTQKMSESRRGNKHPLYGKKHNKGTIELMKAKKIGKNNPMFGKCSYTIWIEKFGKEIADKKVKEWKNKLSTSRKKQFKMTMTI